MVNLITKTMNIAKILKKCPKGTKLYSPVYGELELDYVNDVLEYPIRCIASDGADPLFASDGRIDCDYPDAECVLFPSRDQRDWNKFEIPNQSKPKHQFKPFEMVLVRDENDRNWTCNFFSYINDYGEYICIDSYWKQCIPYEGNEHLLGTTNAPE